MSELGDMTRDAWLAWRRLGLGGSDMHHLHSDKPDGCALQLAYDKTNTRPDFRHELDETDPMRAGTSCERSIALDYGERTSRVLLFPGPAEHATLPWARVSVDGEIAPVDEPNLAFPHEGPGVLEVKLHNHWFYEKVKAEGLKAGHIRQIQWGMFVRGFQWGSFCVADHDSAILATLERLRGDEPRPIEMVHFDVARNDELIDQSVQAGTWFMRNLAAGELPEALPEVDDRCRKCAWRVRCRGSAMTGAVPSWERDDDVVDLVSAALDDAVGDYLIEHAKLKQAEADYEEARLRIIELLGDHAAVRTSEGAKIYYRWQGRKGWDSRALEMADPLLELVGDVVIGAQPVHLAERFQRFNPKAQRPLRVYVK